MVELPVDQGYAWAVAAGCFMCIFWSFGITRTLGMVFIEVVEHYHASSALSSLMFGIYTVCGLIAMFVHMFIQGKVSDRLIVCVSGTLTGLSLIVINCSPNIYLFVFLFGITQGFGFNGVLFSTLITLGHYMKERLNLVSGVVFAAGGLGQLVLPHLFRYLLSEYDVRGAFLILGGCILNILVGASLFRPKSYYDGINENLKELSKNKFSNKIKNFHSTADSISQADVKVWSTHETDDKGLDNPSFSDCQTSDNTLDNIESDKLTNQNIHDCQSQIHSHNSDILRLKTKMEGIEDNQHKELSVHGMTVKKCPEQVLKIPLKMTEHPAAQIPKRHLSIQTTEITFENDQMIKVTKEKKQISLKKAVMILCKSRTFLLFNAGRLLSVIGYFSCILFYPPYLISLGFELSSISLLLSVVGIADMPAKVFHGWATSFEKIDAAIYAGLCTMLANVIIGVCVLLPSFVSQIGIAIAMGSLLSSNSGLMNVLLMDCTDLQLFPKALVLHTISIAIFMTVLPVIYGWLYDVTGSYFIQLCLASIVGVLGGVITIVEAKTRQPVRYPPTE